MITKPVYLLTDASRLFGLGYALGHIELDNCGKEIFKIVHCSSKGRTSTQQRYSTIELECLAIAWATLKCSFRTFKIRICQNLEVSDFLILKVSESESVRIFEILKLSESESVRILKILKVSEFLKY